MRLGTYTTFDAPTENETQAFEWLSKQFEAIDGYAREVINAHDFGSYPSYEIDYPSDLIEIKEDQDELIEQPEDAESLAKLDRLDQWHDKADKIYTEYNEAYFSE